MEIDGKLNFNHHIRNICKSTSNQLNALIRLQHRIRGKKDASKLLSQCQILIIALLYGASPVLLIEKQNRKPAEKSFTLLVEQL